ncbi:MAG: cytochrome c [Spirochaetales bacterium]|nr:cytochrome c [Spirochaetales bacterium]
MKQMTFLILVLVFPLLLHGCTGQTSSNEVSGTAWAPGSFTSNGQRIYFTGTSERGTSITYSGGPVMGMMMMGGSLACASCHGTDAKGGKHMMGMEINDAPDIRWSALINMQEEEDKHAESGTQEHHEYDFAAFKGSVENGRHPDGDKVNENMPRWKMSDADLKDLMNYLKSLE